MSKRFGRNQKRAFRERVSELEYAHQMDSALLSSQRRKLSDLEEVINRAADIAGEMSVIFPAKSVHTQRPSMPSWEVAINDRMAIYQPMSMPMDQISYQTQRLQVMLGKIDEDAMRMATHFMIRFGDKKWGYALSEQAIQSTPSRHLVRMVTEQLGKVIGVELKAQS